MLVKICGITRLDDALAAVDAGANAIGLICWPRSPRFVDPYRVREIAAALPPFVSAVGVFVNQSADEISAIAALARLSAIQLHGDETPAFAASLRRPVIKSAPPTSAGDSGWPANVLLLLDADDKEKRGGTGTAIDWDAAAAVAARRRVLLSGGLTPENIGTAIGRVRPFGVDVSSGVEEAPGIKDHARIRALFKAIYAIDSSHQPA